MSYPQSKFQFNLMAFIFLIRDIILPRKKILEEVGVKSGDSVLDYGCGSGSYIIPLAELVGESGKIYALDINPLAIEKGRKIVSKNRLLNVHFIISDCDTLLPNSCLDVVLLYDILHALKEPDMILNEIHRLLKPKGILSCNDHHLKRDEILSRITQSGLFKLSEKGKKTYNFVKSS
jgi:ubiquinone/menaquinone biosynthesis C-methylase UbiE